MKVVVTANIVPFMHGGADYHIEGLSAALQNAGHEVELVRFPFRFSPEADIARLMEFCEHSDFSAPNGVSVDKVISLQFPAYGVSHPDHRIWVMHQHRAAYELYDEETAAPGLKDIRQQIHDFDARVLSKAKYLFANSECVARRLKTYNGLNAEALYHPPHMSEHFYCAEAQPYVFFPSRLERLKRQDLLIEAARHLQTPVKILLGGVGGQEAYYQSLVADWQLEDRVRLLGRFSEAEKLALYANALAVFFGPQDEDYGYITLEAMLSSKPVITCTDSGGPLEFVVDGETGYVTEPDARAIAEAIDTLYRDSLRARSMGKAGRDNYDRKNIGWDTVVDSLLRE